MTLDEMVNSNPNDQAPGTTPGRSLDDLVATPAAAPAEDPRSNPKSVFYRPSRMVSALKVAGEMTGIPAAARLGAAAGRGMSTLIGLAKGTVSPDYVADRAGDLDTYAQPIMDSTQLATLALPIAKFGVAPVAKAALTGAVGAGSAQLALGPEAANAGNRLAEAGHPLLGSLVAGAPALAGGLAGNLALPIIRRAFGAPMEAPVQSQISPQDRITPAQAARNEDFAAQAGQITPAQARMPLNNEMPPNKYSDYERQNYIGKGAPIQAQQMAALGPEGQLGRLSEEIGNPGGSPEGGNSPIARDIGEYGQALNQLPAQAKGQVDTAFGKAREMLQNLPETPDDEALGMRLRNSLREYMSRELNIPFSGRRPAPYNANMKLDEPTYRTLVDAYNEAPRAQSPEELLTQRQNFGSAADRAFQAYEKGTPDREARVQTNAYKLFNGVLDDHLKTNFPDFLPQWKQANALASHVRQPAFTQTADLMAGAKDPRDVVAALINGKSEALNNYVEAFGKFNPTQEGASKGLIVPGAKGAPQAGLNPNAQAMQQLKEASLAELWRRSQTPDGELSYAKLRNTWQQTFTPDMKRALFSPDERAALDNLVSSARAATALQRYSYKANPSGTALMQQTLAPQLNPVARLLSGLGGIKRWWYYGPGQGFQMPREVSPSPAAEGSFAGSQAAGALQPSVQDLVRDRRRRALSGAAQ